MKINLLTPEIRRKIEARRILRMWYVLWGIGALLGGGLLAWQWNEYRELHLRVADLECKCKPLHALQEKLDAGRTVLARQTAERDQLLQLQPVNNVLSIFGALVQSAQRQPGTVQIQRLNLLTSTPAPNAGGPPSGNTQVSMASCSLQGVAKDDTALAQFMAGLRESNAFGAVELKSSTQQTGEAGPMRQYQIECRLEELP